jgi:hypothetical protein
MHKKILGICAALVALAAFAIAPAMAAASPLLTDPDGTVLVGSKLTATGLNSSEFSSGFITVKCNDYWMTGTVTSNTTGNVKGTIEKASFNNWNEAKTATEDCSSTLGATKVTIPALTNEVGGTQHWCIEANGETIGEGSVAPHACGGTGGVFTFVLDVTNFFGSHVICRYTRSTNIPIVYTVGTDVVSLKGEQEFKREETSSSSCSEVGKLKNMSFTLETDVSPFKPITIS